MNAAVLRAVILTNGNFFARLIIRRMLAGRKFAEVRVLEVRGDYGGRTGLQSLIWVARRTAVPYLVFKVVTIAATWLCQRLVAREPRGQAYCGAQEVACVTRVSSDAAVEFVRESEPDLLISVSCPQKVPPTVLSLARIGAINVHSSLLPKYAGLAPYFWVLANNERTTGTTVHFMTSRFDEGRILSQRVIEIEPRCSAFSLFRKLAGEGGEALVDAIELVAQGALGAQQSIDEKSYFSHPSFQAYIRLRRNGFVLMRLRELVALARGSLNEA